MQLTQEQITSLENGAKAFNEYKGKFDEIAKTVDHLTHTIAPKMDAFDQASFKKMADDISKAAEESQKIAARAEAA